MPKKTCRRQPVVPMSLQPGTAAQQRRVAVSDDEAAGPEDDRLHEVMQLVEEHTHSVEALAVFAAVSPNLQSAATKIVRTDILALLANMDSRLLAAPGLAPLRWLLHTAGPEVVNSPGVARALMRLTRRLPVASIEQFGKILRARKTGFKDTTLTDELLVLLARNCPTSTDKVFPQNGSRRRWGRSLSPLYEAFSALGPRDTVASPISSAVAQEIQRELLPEVTADNLPDLLHLACNRHEYKPSSAASVGEAPYLLQMLWRREQERVRLLHGRTSSSNVASTAGSSTQDTKQEDRARALVQELLATCLLTDNGAMAQRLCATPAAAALGTTAIMDLLQQAAPFQGHSGAVVARLLRLPGAQDIPSSFISELLQRCLRQDQRPALVGDPGQQPAAQRPYTHAVGTATLRLLLRQPGTRDIPSDQLCEALVWAVQHTGATCGCCVKQRMQCEGCELVDDLGRLVKERAKRDFELESSLVKRLLKACIDDPLPFKLHFGCAFQATPREDLARTARPIPSSMFDKIFDVVTVDDAMELVEHYAATGACPPAQEHMDVLLGCIMSYIHDSDRLSRCILAVANSLDRVDTLSPLLRGPAAYAIERSTWQEVLRCVLDSKLPGIPAALFKLGPAQELNTKQVSDLMRLAREKQDWDALASLAQLPGASGMGQAALLRYMRSAVAATGRNSLHWDAVVALAGLPAARELPPAVVQELCDAVGSSNDSRKQEAAAVLLSLQDR